MASYDRMFAHLDGDLASAASAAVTAREPSSSAIRDFLTTMPKRYKSLFDDRAIRSHAGVSLRRGDSPSRIEPSIGLSAGELTVCVVADDKPGLLSRISSAFVTHRIDVVAAQVFCRQTGDGARHERGPFRTRREAVDLFALRRSEGIARGRPITHEEIASVGDVLAALIRSNATIESAARFASAMRGVDPKATRVRFVSGESGRLVVLLVETSDRPGLLFAITAALFRRRIQIVRSELRTEGDRAIDRFYLAEFDGAPLSASRQFDLQTEVLAAIDEVKSRDPEAIDHGA